MHGRVSEIASQPKFFVCLTPPAGCRGRGSKGWCTWGRGVSEPLSDVQAVIKLRQSSWGPVLACVEPLLTGRGGGGGVSTSL